MLGNMDESSSSTPLLREPSSVDFDFILKILVVGDSVVGKSQLFRRFADESFMTTHNPTQSVEYRHRYIDTENNRCKVQLWDCVSSASRAVMMSIYKGSNAVILLFDVTNISTLESIPDWLNEVKEYAPATTEVYLVGTKIDLPSRRVSESEGRDVATRHGLKYFEVSSKTGEKVDALFNTIVADLEDSTMKRRDTNEEFVHKEAKRRQSVKQQQDQQKGEFTGDDEDDNESKCCNCTIM
jgi:small GTP-binding protein